jgi:hypothetical protein
MSLSLMALSFVSGIVVSLTLDNIFISGTQTGPELFTSNQLFHECNNNDNLPIRGA